MPAIEELALGIGFKKQSAIQTPLVAADIWQLSQTSRNVAQPLFNNETNRDDIGKGGAFATVRYPSHIESNWQWDAFMTSENLAMLGVFGIGLDAKSAAGVGFKYSCKPSEAFDVNVPLTTVVNAVRQGASDVFDFAMIDMACEEFTLSWNSGTGRQAASMSSQWIGSGKYVSPSTITIPAATSEHALNAGSITAITINGVNYIANSRFVSAQFRYKNNIRTDSGYFPGSGSQDNYQIRGRMERGKPEINLTFRVRIVDGSTELSDLLAGTEGTATITAVGANFASGTEDHKLNISLPRIVYTAVPISEDNGILTVDVTAEVLKHNSNGVCVFDVWCEQDSIGTAAS